MLALESTAIPKPGCIPLVRQGSPIITELALRPQNRFANALGGAKYPPKSHDPHAKNSHIPTGKLCPWAQFDAWINLSTDPTHPN